MNEEGKGVVKEFLLPWNIVFFQIGETMRKRKFVAASANIYNQTSDTVTLELKGKSPSGCVGNFKIRIKKKEAKELADVMLKAL